MLSDESMDAFARLNDKYGKNRRTKAQRKQRAVESQDQVESTITDILEGEESRIQAHQLSATHRANLDKRAKANAALHKHLVETLGQPETPLPELQARQRQQAIDEHRAAEGDQVMGDVIDILEGAEDQYGKDLQKRLRDQLGADSDTVD